MSNQRMTRRQMIKGLGLVAAGSLLAACQPKVVEVTKEKIVKETVKETVIVAGTPQIVEKVVEKVVTMTPVPKPAPEIWVDFTSPSCVEGGAKDKVEAVRNYIYDKTGVKVYAYMRQPGTAGTEKINLTLASGTQPLDILEGAWPDFKGITLPLDDLLKQYGQNILRMNPPESWRLMKDWEGTTWSYPRLGPMGHTHFWYFRSDWLDALGKKVPTNWDEMEDVIAAMLKAHPEAVVAADGRGNLMNCTVGAFVPEGNSKWVDPATKMVMPLETNPGYRDWVVRMNQWWRNNWFQKETFAGPDFRAMLKTLTISTWLGWYSRITIWWEDLKREAKWEKEDYVHTESMKGPKGLARTNNNGGNSGYMIPRKSKYPDAAIRFVNWIYDGLPKDPTNYIIAGSGLEGVGWEWVDKSKSIYKSLSTGLKCEERYAGDFQMARGMGTEPYAVALTADGKVSRQNDHTIKYWNRYDLGKWAIDYDVPYDTTVIRQKFPGLGDMDRLFNEETIKFITGVRPLSEWDAFQKQIESAGLKQWSEAYTEQYRRYHPA